MLQAMLNLVLQVYMCVYTTYTIQVNSILPVCTKSPNEQNNLMRVCVCMLTKYCMAMERLSGPGGPIRKTSWPSRSFCMIHRRCWATV
jgi:hypothetical protein